MKISVCIPLYNGREQFLKEAIDSILSQSAETPPEIIVLDDASRVDYEAIRSFYPHDVLQWHRNEINQGMVRNWNEAVRKTTGDLVLCLCQDDRLLPEFLQTYLEIFRNDPQTLLCSGGRKFIDDCGVEVGHHETVHDRSRIYLLQKQYRLEFHELLRLCLRNGNAIGELSAMMFRRKDFDKIGGFDPLFSHAADVDFALRMAQQGTVVYWNRPLLERRIHRDNLTWKNRSSGAISRDRVLMFERYVHLGRVSPQEKARFLVHQSAKSFYDFFRALQGFCWQAGWIAIKNIARFTRWSPVLYLQYLREMMSGRNVDAR